MAYVRLTGLYQGDRGISNSFTQTLVEQVLNNYGKKINKINLL
jgi:hypothetical protein